MVDNEIPKHDKHETDDQADKRKESLSTPERPEAKNKNDKNAEGYKRQTTIFLTVGRWAWQRICASSLTDWFVASATIAIALTGFYQWRDIGRGSADTHALAQAAQTQATQAIGQLSTMQNGLKVVMGVSGERYGRADVQVQGIGIYHEGATLTVSVALWNIGGKDAREVAAYALAQFGSLGRRISENDAQFRDTVPNELPAYRRTRTRVPPVTAPIPPLDFGSQNIYISGWIKYTDYRDTPMTVPFCRYVPAKTALNTALGFQGGFWLDPGATNNCEN